MAGTEDKQLHLTASEQAIILERRRQIQAEGFTPIFDDRWTRGNLARAAAAYAMSATAIVENAQPRSLMWMLWPFDRADFKVTTSRRSLVKAGALIIAELDRLDRAASQSLGNSLQALNPEPPAKGLSEGETETAPPAPSFTGRGDREAVGGALSSTDALMPEEPSAYVLKHLTNMMSNDELDARSFYANLFNMLSVATTEARKATKS